ncbi:BTB/POZ and MATH domain-containing protein 1-like [Lolium rigidum]|uniref:BTB/POZ and MATH domain-containing protein 1-like n=1 Tax=Lolium rigidum TaxID=89674 RepID=UPI001F5D491B|nr:BTB/POZ and MATH domain-containing protein 1-like [Lolium rigidum]
MAEYTRIPVAVVGEKRFHVMKIERYSRAKQLLITGRRTRSACFSVGGHSWAVQCYLNGDTDPDFISLYLLLDSSNDAREVTAEFRFSVLDKDGEAVDSLSRTHCTRTFQPKGLGWGYSSCVRKADLERSAHLRDDSFSIGCDVAVMKAIGSRVARVVPPSDLHRHLGDLLKSKDGTDVTFQVGGESFSAHRSVLAARSSVFKAELFGAMRENTVDPIEIRDMEADVFMSLLRFIYTDSLLEASPDSGDGGEAPGDVVMAGHLLVAADRYNIERLKLICERKLCSHIDTNMVATSLALAEQHGCHALKEACLQFLASPSNLEGMKASEGYKHLKSSCPSVLKELVARLLPAELKAAKDIIMEI